MEHGTEYLIVVGFTELQTQAIHARVCRSAGVNQRSKYYVPSFIAQQLFTTHCCINSSYNQFKAKWQYQVSSLDMDTALIVIVWIAPIHGFLEQHV